MRWRGGGTMRGRPHMPPTCAWNQAAALACSGAHGGGGPHMRPQLHYWRPARVVTRVRAAATRQGRMHARPSHSRSCSHGCGRRAHLSCAAQIANVPRQQTRIAASAGNRRRRARLQGCGGRQGCGCGSARVCCCGAGLGRVHAQSCGSQTPLSSHSSIPRNRFSLCNLAVRLEQVPREDAAAEAQEHGDNQQRRWGRGCATQHAAAVVAPACLGRRLGQHPAAGSHRLSRHAAAIRAVLGKNQCCRGEITKPRR